MELPDNLRYSKEHEWAMLEDGVVTVGITDYAQSELGDVVYVELPKEGDTVMEGEPFGVVESVKSVSDLCSPVSGKVVEINAGLEAEPETVNASPYKLGWLIKVECSDDGELELLMTSKQYLEYVNSLK